MAGFDETTFATLRLVTAGNFTTAPLVDGTWTIEFHDVEGTWLIDTEEGSAMRGYDRVKIDLFYVNDPRWKGKIQKGEDRGQLVEPQE